MMRQAAQSWGLYLFLDGGLPVPWPPSGGN